MSLELDEARAKLSALEAQLLPENDATDAAHAAWWRGHDDGAKGMTELVEKLKAKLAACERERDRKRDGFHEMAKRYDDALCAADDLRSQLDQHRAVVDPILELAAVFPPGTSREFCGYNPGTLVRRALDAADALASAGTDAGRTETAKCEHPSDTLTATYDESRDACIGYRCACGARLDAFGNRIEAPRLEAGESGPTCDHCGHIRSVHDPECERCSCVRFLETEEPKPEPPTLAVRLDTIPRREPKPLVMVGGESCQCGGGCEMCSGEIRP